MRTFFARLICLLRMAVNMPVNMSRSSVEDNAFVSGSESGNFTGMGNLQILQARIREKLEETGLSAWKASKLATGSPDVIRQIMAGHQPGVERLSALAGVLGTTTEYLLGGDAGRASAELPVSFAPRALPKDVPVYGTALGADVAPDFDGDDPVIESHLIETGDAIDFLRRPPPLAGRKDVYGLYVAGSSMSPRYDPGDPAYVDPRRPPAIGDDVIVQLAQPDIDGGHRVDAALIKRLVRRTSDYVELEQFNPPMVFRVRVARVASVHRVIPWRELVVV